MKSAGKVVTVVGARPQFIKAAAVSPAIRKAGLREVLVHTGQHYDWEMSASFFEGFKLPRPDHSLGVGSASHGAQTGRMLESVEKVLEGERPEAVVVYGDTNSTLAGALAAAKLGIRIAHVEAGLRSFDREMPEEINRVVTDHLSSILFAPTAQAVVNLRNEGIAKGVARTGDVMYDLFLESAPRFERLAGKLLRKYGLDPGKYALATVHRAENTDDPGRWKAILEAFSKITASGLAVLWPAHPRTRRLLEERPPIGVKVVPPLPYFETQAIAGSAAVILTDSGGLQKEAAFHGVPCVVLRDRTEWVELVDKGFATLADADPKRIIGAALSLRRVGKTSVRRIFGSGDSASKIAGILLREAGCEGNGRD